jgi:hypothetical protein
VAHKSDFFLIKLNLEEIVLMWGDRGRAPEQINISKEGRVKYEEQESCKHEMGW